MIAFRQHDRVKYTTKSREERARYRRDRERGKEREMEHCSERVLASAINLTVGQMFMTAKERIIGYFIKMEINIISKNLGGIIFR